MQILAMGGGSEDQSEGWIIPEHGPVQSFPFPGSTHADTVFQGPCAQLPIHPSTHPFFPPSLHSFFLPFLHAPILPFPLPSSLPTPFLIHSPIHPSLAISLFCTLGHHLLYLQPYPHWIVLGNVCGDGGSISWKQDRVRDTQNLYPEGKCHIGQLEMCSCD